MWPFDIPRKKREAAARAAANRAALNASPARDRAWASAREASRPAPSARASAMPDDPPAAAYSTGWDSAPSWSTVSGSSSPSCSGSSYSSSDSGSSDSGGSCGGGGGGGGGD